MLTALLAVAAAGVAAALVRGGARATPSPGLVCLGAAGGAAGAAVAVLSGAPVPVGSALAGAGLSAAAVIDVVEGRIPTPIARVTVGAAAGALVAHAVLSGDVGAAVRAALLAAVLVGCCALLWLCRAMGYGDVRLSAGTATAMFGGAAALVLLTWIAAAGVGLVALRRRLVPPPVGPDGVPHRAPVAFAPALSLAWALTILVA